MNPPRAAPGRPGLVAITWPLFAELLLGTLTPMLTMRNSRKKACCTWLDIA